MAVTKTILKNTHQEAVVKISGTAGSATIDISVDLLNAKQALNGSTVRVDIIDCIVTGLLGSGITVVRNSVPILAFAPENSLKLNFEGEGFRENIQNNANIVVTISGAEAHIYLVLRKVTGFASMIETAQFGSYDNESAVGS
jgi:hypothetical protein